MRSNLRWYAALLASAAVTIAALTATGAFASSSTTASPAAGVGSGSSSAPVAQASASQAEAFPVLGQPATAADSIASSAEVTDTLAEAESELGANPSLGRVVVADPAGSAVLVPAEGGLCLVSLRGSENASSICRANAGAESNGIGTDEDINEARFSVIGVFPASAEVSNLQAVSAEGAETPVTLSAENGYAFETTTKPVALRWTGADGAEQSRALLWPTLPGH